MLNATRAVAVVAVLALSGSLALLAGPLGRSEEPATVPAAETATTEIDHVPGFFTGTATMSRGQEAEITALADRQEFRQVGTSFTLELDDPRVDGSTFKTVYDYDDFSVSGGRMGVFRGGTGRMENDDGAWVLSSIHGAVAEPEDGSSYTHATMTGEGAYDGLVGTMLMTDYDGAGSWKVVGALFPEQRVSPE